MMDVLYICSRLVDKLPRQLCKIDVRMLDKED